MFAKPPITALFLLACVESFAPPIGPHTHHHAHASISTQVFAAAANPISTDDTSQDQQPTKKRVKPIPYIATTSTVEHSRALSHYLRPGDRVLELGTQLDAATSTICSTIGQGGTAILVDVKRTETKSGRSTQGSRDAEKFRVAGEYVDSTIFVELDQFDQWRTVIDGGGEQSGVDGGSISTFDVMVLDVSAMCGNDLEFTALSTVTEFVNHQLRRDNRPRAVIIKSKSMSSLARRLVHAQRLFDGTATRDLRRPSRDGRPHIVAGVGVEEYRRTIPHIVRRGDAMLEVGCFSGVTTALLHDAATSPEEAAGLEGEEGGRREGFCIGVDIGPKIIVRAQRENPHMHFAVGDGWKSLDLLRLRSKAYPESAGGVPEGYDVVYADIGGLSGPDGTLESLALLDVLGHGLEPRCIVIKSLCMRRLASSLRAYSDVWEKARAEQEEEEPLRS